VTKLSPTTPQAKVSATTTFPNRHPDQPTHPLAQALLTLRPYRPQTFRTFQEIHKPISVYPTPLLLLKPLPTAAFLHKLKARRARIHYKY
jgi:hypothetical protein